MIFFSSDFDHFCIRMHDLSRSCILDTFATNVIFSFKFLFFNLISVFERPETDLYIKVILHHENMSIKI